MAYSLIFFMFLFDFIWYFHALSNSMLLFDVDFCVLFGSSVAWKLEISRLLEKNFQ